MGDFDRISERDPLTGKIISNFISSDEARRMVANRRSKEDKAAEGSLAILQELGYTDENPAPELLKNLAQIAVSQKTGSVSAIGTLLRLAHGKGESGVVQLREGELCPTCGTYYGGLGAELARVIINRLQDAR
ncbi:MAG: hypothetical protein NTW32_26355 [Chloroflexi bacterium]|nr:hypothetical protein [Chloroflexota bacterium]